LLLRHSCERMVSSGNQIEKGEFEGLQLNGTDSDVPTQQGTDSDVPSQQGGTDSDAIMPSRRHRQIIKMAVVGLALVSLFVTVFYCSGKRTISTFAQKHVVALAAPAGATIPCTDYPYVKIVNVTWRNLGQQGPDYGDEGMYFNVTLSNVGTSVTKAQLRIKADKGYKPSSAEWNGINGEWARINFNSGTAASFTAYFWDDDKKTKLELARGYMTFSDLDGGPSAKEFVAVSTAAFSGNHFISKNSSIANNTVALNKFVQSQVDSNTYAQTLLYTGSGIDVGADNPASGDVFTANQKNNAVTLQMGGVGQTDIKFKLGATQGTTSRTIQFNFQPTLLCASTLMPDLTLKTPLDPAFPPKTDEGEVLDAAKFTKYNICTGAQCDAATPTQTTQTPR